MIYRMYSLIFFPTFQRNKKKEIISKKSLEIVKDVIEIIKRYSRIEGLFRRSNRTLLRQYILEALMKGRKLHLPYTPNTAKECAAALQAYLMQLKEPVMPKRVQRLLLADNPGVPAYVIATDALGLIHQDVTGRHRILLAEVLGLMKHLFLYAPASELTELKAPTFVTSFLPVFFDFSIDDIEKWRQVASRLNEIIVETPDQLLVRKQTETNSNAISEPIISLARSRDLSLFHPLIRLIESRNDYLNEPRNRSRSLPYRPSVLGRLHSSSVRLRLQSTRQSQQ